MPKLDKMLSNLKNLASMAAEHRPENPGDYLNLGAGLSSVLGRAHDVAKVNVGGPNAPGYSQRFYNAAKSLLSGELGMTPGVALHEMPQELMTAYETALEAKKGINPSQRLLKGLAGVTGATPAAYEAKQKAMTEALAAERSAADARRNLLLAGVGGAGLLGAAALMGRRAEDPDTYKHSSELGWQPRQKTAAPSPFMTTFAPSESAPVPVDFTPSARPAAALGGMMGPPRPRFLGVSDADAIAAARSAAQFGNFGNARLAAGSRTGERQFTAAQARAFLERNPMAAQRSLGEMRQGFQSQAPAPAAAPRVDAGLYRTLGQSRMPAAPAQSRAPGSMNMSLGQSRMPAPTRIPAGPVSRPQIPQSVATGQ